MSEGFDWKSFHKDLDFATAMMMHEEDILPSSTSLFSFMEFSCNKMRMQEVSEGIKEK